MPDDDKLAHADSRRRAFQRVLTLELAERFAQVLCSQLAHTVESAAVEVGIRASTIREALSRLESDKCGSAEDEEICTVLAQAKASHILALRAAGFAAGGSANNAGTNWLRWQLEVQDPLHHPRKTESAVELSGPGGGPVQTENTVRYVVAVPPDEEPDGDG